MLDPIHWRKDWGHIWEKHYNIFQVVKFKGPLFFFFVILFSNCLQLQDFSKSPLGEVEVKFQLTRDTLEAMLRSMTYINEQLSSMVSIFFIIELKS